jgi:hypothetical protein
MSTHASLSMSTNASLSPAHDHTVHLTSARFLERISFVGCDAKSQKPGRSGHQDSIPSQSLD